VSHQKALSSVIDAAEPAANPPEPGTRAPGNHETMAPIAGGTSPHALTRRMVEVTKPTDPTTLVVEAWAQGFMVGSILIMLSTTVSNYRRGVLLHKLILLEVRRLQSMIVAAVGSAREDADLWFLARVWLCAWHLYL
jgi:hypothetical protein